MCYEGNGSSPNFLSCKNPLAVDSLLNLEEFILHSFYCWCEFCQKNKKRLILTTLLFFISLISLLPVSHKKISELILFPFYFYLNLHHFKILKFKKKKSNKNTKENLLIISLLFKCSIWKISQSKSHYKIRVCAFNIFVFRKHSYPFKSI